MKKQKKFLAAFLTIAMLVSLVILAIPSTYALEPEEEIRTAGHQKTKAANGVYNLRILAVIDSLKYKSAGFTMEVTKENGEVAQYSEDDLRCINAYTGLTAIGEQVMAEDYGGTYFIAIVFENLSVAEGKLEIDVTPYIESEEGEIRYGKNAVINVEPISSEENVLFYDDFSSDTSALYLVTQLDDDATVSYSDGKLHLNGKVDAATAITILLPESASATPNVMITVKATFNSQVNNSRWLAVVFNAQQNDPNQYGQFCARQQSKTRTNGIELSERYLSGSDYKWSIKTKTSASKDIVLGEEIEMTLHIYENYIVGLLNGEIVINQKNTTQFTAGRLGLNLNGLNASISSIKVVETTKPYAS